MLCSTELQAVACKLLQAYTPDVTIQVVCKELITAANDDCQFGGDNSVAALTRLDASCTEHHNCRLVT